jgi:hypothetical protein
MPEREPDPDEAPPFRDLLRQCEALYRSCAEQYARQRPEIVPDARAFVAQMIDLHRGLLLKVFAEIVQCGQHVGPDEMRLGQELFAHAWGRKLSEEQVKESLLHYGETTHLRWESLVRPFERFSAFIAHAAELQALVEQIAWQVAGASGRVSSRARRQVQRIRTELRRILDRVPLAGAVPEAGPAAPRAQQQDFEITTKSAQQQAQAVRVQARPAGEELGEVLAELDALIGLDTIKEEVRELVNFLKIQAERVKYDLPQTPVSLHAVYSGNPGTGKTTVARLVGRILGALGILSRGHLIETDRSGLVAEYAGQTGPKANKRIDEALDGVLFIDEAYSLIAEKGDDPYGAEAVQALLKRMEDERGRLVVILAGYPAPMAKLLHANPGLTSRFGRTFAFPDYTAAELGRIFETMCERDRYQLPPRSRAKLLLGFQHLLDRRDEHFGNGRVARNVFERSVRRLANRLAGVTPLTRELLTTLQPEDVVLEGVPESAWEGPEAEARQFRLSCPQCGHTSKAPVRHLGRKLTCRCGHELTAPWGDLLPP